MKGQQLLVLSLLKNTFSYRLIRGYRYQLSPTDTISLIRKIVSFWYRLLRTDTQINFQKKSSTWIRARQAQIQASRKEVTVGHAEREEEPSAVAAGRGCVTEVCRRPRSNPTTIESRLDPHLGGGWECLLQLLKVWLHAHPPWRKAVVVERRR
jgi:hypothetical protein